MKRLSIENQGENNFKVLSLIDHLPAGVVVLHRRCIKAVPGLYSGIENQS